jgi:hypothetical protein
MRRPTMKDLRLNPVKGADDLTGEMKLIGNLCGLRLEEIELMDMADYRGLTDAFDRFRAPSRRGGDSPRDTVPVPSDQMESA